MDEAVAVAVAVIEAADGRVLVARREAWRHQGGGLEFPGGKIESGESPGDALQRELDEELGLQPQRWHPLMTVPHRYGDREVVLDVYRVTDWAGGPAPAAFEAGTVHWRHPHGLRPEEFPAANRAILVALRLPGISPVTPRLDSAEAIDRDRLADSCARELARGRLVRVRRGAIDVHSWRCLVDRLARLPNAASPGRLIVDADDGGSGTVASHVGLHLSATAARQFNARPVDGERLLSCACHDRAELERARVIGADLAYVGPVQETPSHPDGAPLEWSGLEQLASRTEVPLYAIGGLSPADLARARAVGAVGVAGIRGFWDVEG